jgi:hypothetical protein
MPRRHSRTHGVKKTPSAQHQPRGEVEKVLAEILASGQEAPSYQEMLQRIEQIMAQAASPK